MRRTIGLYILILTLTKVLGYDIWMNIKESIMRVVVLIGIGGALIFISSLYQKKLGGNIKKDLDIRNVVE